jgi:2-keto-4-pentenoate hydratase/2-oxohepta-3-ene-1,7-dioic acid hydratase in catechol pathway
VPDPQQLPIWLKVNGEQRQNGTTADTLFALPKLISYVSEFMTLLPGDIITTGSPAGSSVGLHPPQFLQAGDVVELGIGELGTQRQRIAPFRRSE